MRNVNFARLVGGVCLTVFSWPIAAQDAPATIPGLGNFSLPASQPTPTPTPTPGPPPIVPPVSVTPSVTPRPVPTPTPTPRASPGTPAITLPTLRPTATPTARATFARPAPTATPSPAAVATPEPVETPLTPPSPTPLPTKTPVATTTPPAEPGLPIWLIPAALVGLAVLIGGVIFLRRRRAADAWEEPIADVAPEPEPQPVPHPLPPVTPQATAQAPRFLTPPPPPAPVVLPSSLTIEAPSVRRAGINLITATADVTVVLRNDGPEPLRNIRVEIRLTSAQPGQDAALAAMFAGPIERPCTPPFDLAPGEEKPVRALSTMARDAITVLQAGERPMFVPVIAIRAIDTGPDGERQATAAFALGVERAGSDKLAPFWLDQPPRMYDTIGVRPHALRG